MPRIIDLIETSAVVQGMLALFVLGSDSWLWANGKPVPPELLALTTLIVGFYFGAKSQTQLASTIKSWKKGG